MSSEVFDVAVVGAGPAGATAAALLASKGHSVVLVDRQTFPGDSDCLGWLNAKALPLLREIGVSDGSLRSDAFNDVTFYSADFAKTAKPTFKEPPGCLLDRAELAGALVKAAVEQGVTLVEGCGVAEVQLREPGAVLGLADGRELEGRLLLLSAGWRSPLLDRIGLPRSLSRVGYWTAQVDAPLKGGSGPARPRVGVVLGLDRGASFAQCYLSKDRVSVVVNWAGEPEQTLSRLATVCRLGVEHGVLPVDLTRQASAAKAKFSPAGAALDMDSHVAKHTLVIGDAGGFVAAASNEGIYPSMWSARIAAEVAGASLAGVHSQDELMAFDSAWRMEVADYLRPAQTDTQFLLPLVFSNKPMADRMGAAFFSGENI